MNIIAIDPSLRSTGVYCRAIGAAELTEWAETIKTEDKYRPGVLTGIFGALRLILHHHSFDVALIEGYAFSTHSSSTSALGEVGGVIRLALHLENIPVIEMAPAMWKSVVRAGKIGLPKAKGGPYVRAVNANFETDWATPDECDAYMMALAASRIYNRTCYKTDANEKVRKAILAAMEPSLFKHPTPEREGNINGGVK